MARKFNISANCDAAPAVSNNDRLSIIANLLKSSNGRIELAANMEAPLRDFRDYSGIGRRAFQVAELAQGELPIFDKDIDTPAFVVAEEGDDIQVFVRGERVNVPLFEIATNIRIPITQIREKRFDLQNRSKEKTKTEIIRKEDQIIFNLFDEIIAKGGKYSNTKLTSTKADLTIDTISEAKALIERWGDVKAVNMFINPYQEVLLRKMNKDRFIDFETTKELLNSGYIGRLFNMSIQESSEVPINKIYITAEPEFFGRLVIGQDITVMNADSPETRQIGFSIFEQIGILLHNHKGLAVIEITDLKAKPTDK